MHSGHCIDRSVSYALDREQIVMPKTIFIGLGGAPAAHLGATCGPRNDASFRTAALVRNHRMRLSSS
jgi:hypothetical protein